LIARLRNTKLYRLNDAITNINCGIAQQVTNIFFRAATFVLYVVIYQNLRIWDIPMTWWTWVLLFIAVDFFYYWFHRCQHTNSFLWEQHKFHHSEVSLNVTSSRRVHWLEEPLVLLFIVLPMTLLFNLQPIPSGFLAFIQVLWLQFIHMNLRLGAGKLSPIIVSPQYHRIHHSYQPEHIDKNYAVFFPIWDIIFGSYYHPQKGEFPPTGLTTGETHNHLWEAAILPFREWLKLIKFRKQKPENNHF
jgi:sterol desaturase/sphingolipid hydroxylase (fatty acid hydroxylase superfamily)